MTVRQGPPTKKAVSDWMSLHSESGTVRANWSTCLKSSSLNCSDPMTVGALATGALKANAGEGSEGRAAAMEETNPAPLELAGGPGWGRGFFTTATGFAAGAGMAMKGLVAGGTVGPAGRGMVWGMGPPRATEVLFDLAPLALGGRGGAWAVGAGGESSFT